MKSEKVEKLKYELCDTKRGNYIGKFRWNRIIGELFDKIKGFTKSHKVKCILQSKPCYVGYDEICNNLFIEWTTHNDIQWIKC